MSEVNVRRFSLFQRRVGRDVRAWPTLALLLLVVLVAIGCVLWFMREAMQNERVAVRGKLVDAYRGQLSLVQAQVTEGWKNRLAALDSSGSAVALFARFVREGFADSVICFDEQGRAAYPRLPSAGDAPGRNVNANTELMTLESLTDHSDPRFQPIAAQLRDLVNDYDQEALPSAQRRFIMHELRRLDPEVVLPTLAAEELAARYLETNPHIAPGPILRPAEVRGTWSVGSSGGRGLALFTTAGLQTRLGNAVREFPLPKGVTITVVAPNEDAMTDSTVVTASLAPDLPGWRLSLSLDDNALFDTEAAKRVKLLVAVACMVIAAMSVLSLVIARGFGRQVRLARLKNDLVATVSHELKTPLTAMRAIVDTLLDAKQFDEQKTREYLELLGVENARLSRLIENFLTFSRLERNKYAFAFTQVRPQRIVEEAVAALGERAHVPGCTVESQVADNLPLIRGDVDALVTALLNLLDNAWKYTGDQKRIFLRTEARNGSVCFSVADNGIGLSARDRQRIFDSFYQADQRLARTAGGCGLGLSIVRSIVEAHHGQVRVESEPGRGSTFTIQIPAVAESAS